MAYKQGEIVWLDMAFSNQQDEKERPVLVISNSSMQSYDDVIAVKITKTHINDGFHYKLEDSMLSNPLPDSSSVHFGCVMTISAHIFTSRKKPIRLAKTNLEEIIEKVQELIELE